MKTGRLQFRHYGEIFNTREAAYKYFADIVDATKGEDYRLADGTKLGEPIVVRYKDENNKIQAILSIGLSGDSNEVVYAPLHLIDTAKLSEEIASLSGGSGEVIELLEQEIARATAAEQGIQSELDSAEQGAGLNADGSYTPNSSTNYIKAATSLKHADERLDTELARVEQARKDVTGQDGDNYVPNESLVSRPIAYIADAESLNDADVKLDEAIQALDGQTIKNIVVNDVTGTVTNNIAEVTIDASNVNIGEYEQYSGRVTEPHPIHNEYSVLDAVKQLDVNFLDFTEKEAEALDGLHIVKVTSGLDSNVREAYDLVDKDGHVQENSDRILIYKDTSIYRVYLGHTDDRLVDYEHPEIISGTGDAALCFIYLRYDGLYELVAIDVESFLEESEFSDGLSVNNHVVKVRVDGESEGFLTVGPNGVKVSGVQNAINTAKSEEEARARAAEQSISGTVNSVINNVQELSAATEGEISRAVAREGELQDDIDNTNDKLAELSGNVETLEDVWETPGSFRHTISDIMVTNATAGSSVAAGKTLMRHYVEGTEKMYYVSSNADDMFYNGEKLSTVVSGLISDTLSISAATNAEVDRIDATIADLTSSTASEVARLDAKVEAETDRAEAAEASISGTVNAFSAKTVSEISRLDQKVDDFSAATHNRLDAIQNELDTTQTGAGLKSDGTYQRHNTQEEGMAYITTANSIDNATVLLDRGIQGEVSRATNAENAISGIVNTFSAATVNEVANLQSQLDAANARIDTLETQLQELSGVVETIKEKIIENVYDSLKAIVNGTEREIKVDFNDEDVTATIGFADNAIFGPISLS